MTRIMCLAIPAKVLEIDDVMGVVDLEGNRLRVNFSMVGDVQPGQHVLVHAGFALEVLSDEDVEEIEFYHRQMREAAEGEAP